MIKNISTYKLLLGVGLGTLILLLIPLVAMQFTNEVVWTLSDFIFAGILLSVTGSGFVFVLKKDDSNMYKIGMGIAILSTFLLIWVNLAVGLIGSENNLINLSYFGVIGIGLIIAFLSRFKATGMSYSSFGMAIGFVLIAVIALSSGMQNYPESSVLEILGVNAFFAVPFILSGISFRNAVADLKS